MTVCCCCWLPLHIYILILLSLIQKNPVESLTFSTRRNVETAARYRTRTFVSSSSSSSSSPLSEESEMNHHSLNTNEFISSSSSANYNSAMEKAWKYVTKPLLRLGSQGISIKHGNSLRELLLAHSVVKVKVNSISLGSLDHVFITLKEQAEKSGAPQGMELLMSKSSANTLLIGLPGSLTRIQKGDFPPPPPPTATSTDI